MVGIRGRIDNLFPREVTMRLKCLSWNDSTSFICSGGLVASNIGYWSRSVPDSVAGKGLDSFSHVQCTGSKLGSNHE
jgi:hypothetical protein